MKPIHKAIGIDVELLDEQFRTFIIHQLLVKILPNSLESVTHHSKDRMEIAWQLLSACTMYFYSRDYQSPAMKALGVVPVCGEQQRKLSFKRFWLWMVLLEVVVVLRRMVYWNY